MEDIDRGTKGNFFRDQLRRITRHKFLILIPLIVAFLGSTIVGSSLPRIYKATGIFRVMNPTDDRSVRQRYGEGEKLAVMKQIMLSRSKLLEVIQSVGLDASYKDLPEADREAREVSLVKQLQKKLEVEQKAIGVFSVSYRSDDPEMVARVANAVITTYIEGVLNEEKSSMAETVTFLEKQVGIYKEKVSESSEALEKFRAQHILALPGSYLSESVELRKIMNDLDKAQQDLSDAETAKKEIEKQIQQLDPTVIGETVVESNPVLAQYKAKLDQLELQLATLKARFTDLHPSVVDTKSEIESLKLLMEKAAGKTTISEKRQANPLYLSLQGKLRESEVQIVSATQTVSRLTAKKQDFEKRVQGSPALEKQLAELTETDLYYRKLRDQYTEELQAAKIQQEREINEKGTRFPVQDYARKPTSPEQSGRLKIAILGLLLGGGLGVGLAVLKDQMNTSFRDVADAATFLDIPVIGTIPIISTAAEQAKEKKRAMMGWIVVGILFVFLVAAIAVALLTSFTGG